MGGIGCSGSDVSRVGSIRSIRRFVEMGILHSVRELILRSCRRGLILSVVILMTGWSVSRRRGKGRRSIHRARGILGGSISIVNECVVGFDLGDRSGKSETERVDGLM